LIFNPVPAIFLTHSLTYFGLKSQDPAVPEQQTFRAFSKRIIVCLFKEETEAILQFTKHKPHFQDGSACKADLSNKYLLDNINL